MMGYQPDAQPKLFYHSFNLDDRIPAISVLRKIRKTLILNLSIRRISQDLTPNYSHI